MTTYYLDSSVAVGGDGLSPATAFKYIASFPTTDSHTFRVRADGVVNRPAATIPTNLTSANIAKTLGASITLESYGTGNPILSGGVLWTGSVGSETLNGVTCKVFDQGVEVSALWFPRSDRVATCPSICSPTDDDSVDSFIESPQDFDNVQPGMAGFRFPGPSNWGGNTNSAKEVYYTGSGSSYTVTIRAPGFWARANAVRSLIGAHVMMRTGANYTNYFPVITAYDSVDGSVTISSPQVPYAGSSNDLFFYALCGHAYGVRQTGQYGMLAGNVGWSAAMADGSAYDIACYSTVFFTTSDNLVVDVSKTWVCEALSHCNDGTRGGAFIQIEDGNDNLASNFTIGPITARQIRNFGREGAVLALGGNGSIQNVTASTITQLECMGIRMFSCAVGGSGGVASQNITVTGPLWSEEGAGGIRISGAGPGPFVIQDVVMAPRASVHDNGGNIYQEAKSVTWDGGAFVGLVNPFATQWNKVYAGSPTTSADNDRSILNYWLSGRPLIDLSGWATTSIIRHDDGGTGALYDRVVAVGGNRNYFARDAEGPNTGMIVQRSVLDKVLASAVAGQDLTGITFRHCVFTGAVSQASAYPSIVDYLEALGATVEKCLESVYTFAGSITDDMWKKLTLNDAFAGYEAIDPWLAPQLKLKLPAYGAARTIVAPAFVHIPFRVGQPAGSMYGAFVNPNPLAEMSLPAGQGDNDKLESSLYAGYNVIPAVPCPDQVTFTVVLDVTDSGATNGPTQRFSYAITIGASGGSPPPDPEPPPVIITTGSLLRLRLF